jgi:hypothetical protein
MWLRRNGHESLSSSRIRKVRAIAKSSICRIREIGPCEIVRADKFYCEIFRIRIFAEPVLEKLLFLREGFRTKIKSGYLVLDSVDI